VVICTILLPACCGREARREHLRVYEDFGIRTAAL
jgi:hypothetical protein